MTVNIFIIKTTNILQQILHDGLYTMDYMIII